MEAVTVRNWKLGVDVSRAEGIDSARRELASTRVHCRLLCLAVTIQWQPPSTGIIPRPMPIACPVSHPVANVGSNRTANSALPPNSFSSASALLHITRFHPRQPRL
nr:unnamed protein product [Digitaria exilis]